MQHLALAMTSHFSMRVLGTNSSAGIYAVRYWATALIHERKPAAGAYGFTFIISSVLIRLQRFILDMWQN